MKIYKQIRHLLLGKPPREARHESLSGQDHPPHFRVRRGRAAWQGRPFENCMEIWGNFLEREVIVLVAMRAADGIEMLTLSLLRR